VARLAVFCGVAAALQRPTTMRATGNFLRVNDSMGNAFPLPLYVAGRHSFVRP
jgi:hypothetical protein